VCKVSHFRAYLKGVVNGKRVGQEDYEQRESEQSRKNLYVFLNNNVDIKHAL